jgi:hypothetical protein
MEKSGVVTRRRNYTDEVKSPGASTDAKRGTPVESKARSPPEGLSDDDSVTPMV